MARKSPLTVGQVYAIVGVGAALSVCLVVALVYLVAVWK